MQQLKDLRHIPKEINTFLGEQFAQGEGTSWQEVDPTISDDNKESSEEDVASE